MGSHVRRPSLVGMKGGWAETGLANALQEHVCAGRMCA